MTTFTCTTCAPEGRLELYNAGDGSQVSASHTDRRTELHVENRSLSSDGHPLGDLGHMHEILVARPWAFALRCTTTCSRVYIELLQTTGSCADAGQERKPFQGTIRNFR